MANDSLIYVNARVKSLENGFLSEEKINRMVYSESLEEAVRVLLESNYGAGTVADAYNFEKILNAEDVRVSQFMSECSVEKMGLETFSIKRDYHNAKALMKAKYMHQDDVSYMLVPSGLIDVQTLKEFIFSDNYSSLSKTLSDALLLIDNKRALGNKSPRLIDLVLDKAMYEEINLILKKAKAPSIIEYWQASIDFSNISSFIRYRKIGFDVNEFSNDFINGGIIDKSTFVDFYDQALDVILEKLKYTKYSQVISQIDENSLVKYEASCDNYLINIFKENKADVFSVAPLAGYYLAKKMEIKQVRMILILIKNKISVDVIKQRLREIYA